MPFDPLDVQLASNHLGLPVGAPIAPVPQQGSPAWDPKTAVPDAVASYANDLSKERANAIDAAELWGPGKPPPPRADVSHQEKPHGPKPEDGLPAYADSLRYTAPGSLPKEPQAAPPTEAKPAEQAKPAPPAAKAGPSAASNGMNPLKVLTGQSMGAYADKLESMRNQVAELGSQLELHRADMNERLQLQRQLKVDQEKQELDNKTFETNAANEAAAIHDKALTDAAAYQAMHKDPDRWYKKRGTAGGIMAAIAMGMGAFGASINKTQNFAQEIIEKSINDDLEAQQSEIEKAGKIAANSVAAEDRHFVKTEAERHQRNVAKTQTIANAMQQMDMVAANTNDADAISRLASMREDLKGRMADIRKDMADSLLATYKRDAAAANSQAYSEDKKYDAYLEDILKHNAANPEKRAEILSKQQWKDLRSGTHHVERDLTGTASGKDKGLNEIQTRQLDGAKNALNGLYQIRDMIKEGGHANRARTAKGEALMASTVNSMSIAETGGAKAPSPEEMHLLQMQVPKDPNAYQFSGADLARTETSIAKLESQVKALEAQQKGGK